MKKAFLITAILLTILYSTTRAQEQSGVSGAEKKFTVADYTINQQHIVRLSNDISLNIELFDVRDYACLRNLDSLMEVFRADMANYKDSLAAPASGNIRIDYMFMSKENKQSMRFKKYESDGDLYSSNHGEIARLKIDKDTVRIIIAKYEDTKVWAAFRYTPIQLTFVAKDFNDILTLKDLNQIIDTLEKKTRPKKQYSIPRRHKATVYYEPSKNNFSTYQGLQRDFDYGSSGIPVNSNDLLLISGNVGIGLLRDRLAPMAEVKIQLCKPWGRKEKAVYAISATPYFLFDKKADGNYATRANWFLNIEMGSVYDQEFEAFKIRSITFGAGYLLKTTNSIFNGQTVKAFLNLGLANGFQLAPEVVFTDNFRQVFPAMTLRIFKQ